MTPERALLGSPRRETVRRRDNGPGIGLLLGLANAAVIAIGVSAAEGHGAYVEIAIAVFMFGVMPALIAGLAIGHIADRTATYSLWARRIAITVPAWLVVMLVGCGLGMGSYVVVACIPTTVAAVVLERLTRERSIAAAARVVAR